MYYKYFICRHQETSHNHRGHCRIIHRKGCSLYQLAADPLIPGCPGNVNSSHFQMASATGEVPGKGCTQLTSGNWRWVLGGRADSELFRAVPYSRGCIPGHVPWAPEVLLQSCISCIICSRQISLQTLGSFIPIINEVKVSISV